MSLLRHDRLPAIGGPHHGETLPIISGADRLLTCEPARIDITALGDEHADYLPGPLRTTTYKRTRISTDERWYVDLLLAEGCQLRRVQTQQLTWTLCLGIVIALGRGICWHPLRWLDVQRNYAEDDASFVGSIEWVPADPRPMHSRPRYTHPPISADTWSDEDVADRCWRCDAASSTTDVGLCDACLTDLQAAA